MPFQFTSFLIPKNGNTFFLLEDKYVKGGLQVRADSTERDAIPAGNRKPGMIVVTQSDNKLWQLGADLTSWTEVQSGGGLAGTRQTVTFVTNELQPNGFEDFVLSLGKSALVLSLSVSVPMLVEAFETADRNDSNPYTFLATEDHVVDDGTTLMTDGTVFKNRRYSMLVNAETPPSADSYFRITNVSQIPSGTTLTLMFLPLE